MARIWPLQTLIRRWALLRPAQLPHALYRKFPNAIPYGDHGRRHEAVYPEGGLSRDGKLRPPKVGLLDYMLRSFDPAGERDLVFIPVGINYDRTLEDRSLLSDLEPAAEKKSSAVTAAHTLAFIFRNLRLMVQNKWYRFGYASSTSNAGVAQEISGDAGGRFPRAR